MIVGESARAANFSLNGYERDTNKALKPFAKEMMIFKKARACGTSTAISVPCLFSPYERTNFVAGSSSYTENVLDVLAYNGYQLLWRENNSSCKGNCNRIPTEVFCQDGKCYDELMNNDIAEKVRAMGDKAVIVLHQHGSHGPDYFLRYPEEFEIYKPVCKDEVLKNCTLRQIRNTYDNSIAYTSHVVADLLKNCSLWKMNITLPLSIRRITASLWAKTICIFIRPYMIMRRIIKRKCLFGYGCRIPLSIT